MLQAVKRSAVLSGPMATQQLAARLHEQAERNAKACGLPAVRIACAQRPTSMNFGKLRDTIGSHLKLGTSAESIGVTCVQAWEGVDDAKHGDDSLARTSVRGSALPCIASPACFAVCAAALTERTRSSPVPAAMTVVIECACSHATTSKVKATHLPHAGCLCAQVEPVCI